MRNYVVENELCSYTWLQSVKNIFCGYRNRNKNVSQDIFGLKIRFRVINSLKELIKKIKKIIFLETIKRLVVVRYQCVIFSLASEYGSGSSDRTSAPAQSEIRSEDRTALDALKIQREIDLGDSRSGQRRCTSQQDLHNCQALTIFC